LAPLIWESEMLRPLFAGLIAAACLADAASAQSTRAKADVDCKPAGQLLHYDCVIKLVNARTSEPLAGVTLMVGADMPSMPMMHNVRPVKATPGADSGTYQARLVLEMHGDWAVQLNLSGPVRDRVIANIRFDPDRATPTVPSRARPGHKH
jgi:YtkA-like protein